MLFFVAVKGVFEDVELWALGRALGARMGAKADPTFTASNTVQDIQTTGSLRVRPGPSGGTSGAGEIGQDRRGGESRRMADAALGEWAPTYVAPASLAHRSTAYAIYEP